MSDIYVKKHGHGLLSLCDKDLIGAELKDGDLTIEISEHFYKGRDIDDQKIIELVKEAKNLNIFGRHSIDLAIKCGAIDKENVREIDGVPHAQMISIQ